MYTFNETSAKHYFANIIWPELSSQQEYQMAVSLFKELLTKIFPEKQLSIEDRNKKINKFLEKQAPASKIKLASFLDLVEQYHLDQQAMPANQITFLQNFKLLPDGILPIIFSHLAKTDLTRLSLVSKFFHTNVLSFREKKSTIYNDLPMSGNLYYRLANIKTYPFNNGLIALLSKNNMAHLVLKTNEVNIWNFNHSREFELKQTISLKELSKTAEVDLPPMRFLAKASNNKLIILLNDIICILQAGEDGKFAYLEHHQITRDRRATFNINALKILSDGAIAIGESDKINIWKKESDGKTLKCIQTVTLNDPRADILAIEILPDDSLAVMDSVDYRITIWQKKDENFCQVHQWKTVKENEGGLRATHIFTSAIPSIKVLPDGNILSVAQIGEFKLWGIKPKSGQYGLLQTLKYPAKEYQLEITAIAITPSGDVILGDTAGQIMIWGKNSAGSYGYLLELSVENKEKLLNTLPKLDLPGVENLALLQDGTLIVLFSNNKIKIWNSSYLQKLIANSKQDEQLGNSSGSIFQKFTKR